MISEETREEWLGMGESRHWLNAERVTSYSKIFIALYIAIAIGWVAMSREGISPNGKPLGYDFITFWSASYTWLHGDPADAYDLSKLFEVQKLAVAGTTTPFAWFYPPTFYFVILPLAVLPYAASYLSFVGASFLGFIAAIRKIVPVPNALLAVFAFPGVFVNAAHGQNGFLTAMLAACSLMLIESRSVRAGALAGLLVIKPHLAVLFPLAFLFSGQTKAAMTMIISALVFTALSISAVGIESLKAFIENMALARTALEAGMLPWIKMPTVFAFMRLLGAGITASYAAHIVVACLVAFGVAVAWFKRWPFYLRASALLTGSLLITPYLYDYDLVWLAFPIAWIAIDGLRHGWLKLERETLLAAWLSPLLVPSMANLSSIQVGPLITCLLFLTILRRGIYVANRAEKECKN
ncbi:glycosyltransferase family 87 protein [Noviherbaspirillum pedocola]|uniref:DUF2029 domain-containing protein n=1 Tax=Noviherbaspirillum pedocola TaxID=2801341 RepID=A0A934W5F0_9BURK|nr:glycosyltransferase family 87 protein [Noviherbaspirillum pedocola]MBK4733825.1 DUF2029 domain-containing protein [Noviherbaspirillum pedocola]